MTPVLLALPWLALPIFVRWVARMPRELPPADPSARAEPTDAPFVSVVVPARNERVNIERCLRSLAASRYPAFEIVVIDDRSTDDTAALAAAVPAGNARSLRVLAGAELPDGWLGKPWACQQGADASSGALLLFTDADTTHGPELLGRAVAGLREERADLMTVLGRQLMETFWERLVQPHIFLMMMFRFPAFERTAKNRRWRDAIANGQFMLFPRASYEAVGGHASVRDEVVEDLALAQRVKRAGLALRIRSAETDFATRMYRSLGELVAGWSKNLFLGGLQAFPPMMRPVMMPLSLAGGIALWVLPPAVLLCTLALYGVAAVDPSGAGAFGAVRPPAPAGALLVWSATAYAFSAAGFALFTRRMGAPGRYGLIYPLGALVSCAILVRSWWRGTDVEWKGRRYALPRASERD